MMSKFTLVIDNRETKVLDQIDRARLPYETRNLDAGDYQIFQNGELVACFERKTLPDFGASFHDGRYENVQKMLELRRGTKCQLYYIIEEPEHFSKNTRFGNVPYDQIRRAITKLQIRHRIMIIKTREVAGTVEELEHFMACLATEEKKLGKDGYGFEADEDDVTLFATAGATATVTTTSTTVKTGAVAGAADIVSMILDPPPLEEKAPISRALALRVPSTAPMAKFQSGRTPAVQMLMGIPQVGQISAEQILEQCSVFDLLTSMPLNEIKVSGRRLKAPIIDNIERLRTVGDPIIEREMLLKITGIGSVFYAKLVPIFGWIRENQRMPTAADILALCQVGSSLSEKVISALSIRMSAKK